MDTKQIEALIRKLRNEGLERRFLTLSICHLPNDFIAELESDETAARYMGEAGIFVWTDHLYATDQIEPVFLIGQLATEMGYCYVFFDRDVDPIDGLAVFDGEPADIAP